MADDPTIRTKGRTQRRRGCSVVPEYLPAPSCAALLTAVGRCRDTVDLPVVARATGDRALRYQVIDGPTVLAHLPELVALYKQVQRHLEATYGRRLVALNDERAALNVNITPPGGSYRWHYDRNAVTAVLYLNEVTGGQIEMCPGYRISGRWLRKFPRLQRALDALLSASSVRRVVGRPELVEPAGGTLVMMKGDRCLHSVRPVLGDQDRICVVMSFDPAEGSSAPKEALNDYLYTTRSVGAGDPNYTG